MNKGHILKDYYSIKDTEGTLHSGFLAAMDFSGVSLPILNEVTIALLDAHVYNALSRIKALNQWDSYLEYDKGQKEWHIDKAFYDDFVLALEVELMSADKKLETLVSFNFKSLTAQEQETIVYGAKETQRDYDKVVVEVTRGNDTEGQAARTDTHDYDAYTNSRQNGSRTDTHEEDSYIDTHANSARTDTQEIGSRTDTETPGQATVTNKLFPLGAAAFIDDTQSITSQQQTSKTQGQQTIENETGAMTVTDNMGGRASEDTIGQQTITDNMGKQKTTDVYGAQTITRTWGDTQTETDARQDVETIKTRTDMKTRTKVILISPEKLFEIQKELAEVNAYTLFTNAVRRAFGAAYFGGDQYEY